MNIMVGKDAHYTILTKQIRLNFQFVNLSFGDYSASFYSQEMTAEPSLRSFCFVLRTRNDNGNEFAKII
ncbi:MAG: hypothetical protein IKR42_00255 [Campylobacter sp.]|nr:hypothetical protein [Campylobacter sp.]